MILPLRLVNNGQHRNLGRYMFKKPEPIVTRYLLLTGAWAAFVKNEGPSEPGLGNKQNSHTANDVRPHYLTFLLRNGLEHDFSFRRPNDDRWPLARRGEEFA